MQPGSVFTFRIGNGFHGACRVVRPPKKSDAPWTVGHVLVCATRWVATDPSEVLRSPRVKTALRGALFWMKGAPPKTFAPAGVVRVAAAAKPCFQSAPWGVMKTLVANAMRDGDL